MSGWVDDWMYSGYPGRSDYYYTTTIVPKVHANGDKSWRWEIHLNYGGLDLIAFGTEESMRDAKLYALRALIALIDTKRGALIQELGET